MFKETSPPEIVKVTPRMAERWLTKNYYEGQRNIRPKLVNLYANKMRRGEFRTGDVALATQVYNGEETVVANGQHFLNAVVMYGKSVPAKIERYECPTPKDFSLLYGQFDTEGVRSISDIVRVEALALGLEWEQWVCRLIVGALAKKLGKMDADKSERAALLRTHQKFGLFVNTILSASVPKGVNKQRATAHIKKVPVVHAMLLTWERCQQDSVGFWAQVRDGEDLKRNDPPFLLREFLMQNHLTRGRGAVAGLRSVPSHEMTARCITAWNGYRRGKKLTILKYSPAKPIPRAI